MGSMLCRFSSKLFAFGSLEDVTTDARRALVGTAAALALMVFGCDSGKKPEPVADVPVASSSSQVTAAAMSAPAVTPPSPSVDHGEGLRPGESLAGRLGSESSHRPAIKPNADDIFAAFEKLGVTIPRKEQGLGKTYKASYCVFGPSSAANITVTVCEYPDDASALAGAQISKAMFPAMPGRQVFSHKSTMLMLLELKPGDSTRDLEKKLPAAYMAM